MRVWRRGSPPNHIDLYRFFCKLGFLPTLPPTLRADGPFPRRSWPMRRRRASTCLPAVPHPHEAQRLFREYPWIAGLIGETFYSPSLCVPLIYLRFLISIGAKPIPNECEKVCPDHLGYV